MTEQSSGKVKTKLKTTAASKAEASVYPAETEINQYSFMRMPANVMTALDIKAATLPNGKRGHVKTKATIQSYDSTTRVLSIQLKGESNVKQS